MKQLIILATVLPGLAYAHEGHGASNGSTLLHYLAEPAHFGPALLLVCIAVGWHLLRRRNAKR